MENKRLFPAEAVARLAEMFSLEGLELKILLQAKSEKVAEIAKELGELPLPIEVRITYSIPKKLNVKNLARARIKLQIEEKKRRYIPREDRFIVQNRKKMSYQEMASHIGRSEESVRQRIKTKRIKRFGFVMDGVFHSYYSAKEDETIKNLYPSLGEKGLAKIMKRSEKSIQYRARKFKIKKLPPTYLSATKIARLLKVAPPTVINWINQEFLKGSQSGRGAGPYREWRIEAQDFHNFIRDCYFLYEPKLVQDKFLRSIIKTTPAGRAMPICQAVNVLGISKAETQRRIKSGELNAYKSFAGRRGFVRFRWFVLLDVLASNQ